MGLLRMPEALSGCQTWQGRKRVTKEGEEYLFTSHIWPATAWISSDRLIVEGGYVDPVGVFPANVIKSVNYAIKRGAEAYVACYIDDEGKSLGAVLKLTWGGLLLGIYAVRLVPRQDDGGGFGFGCGFGTGFDADDGREGVAP